MANQVTAKKIFYRIWILILLVIGLEFVLRIPFVKWILPLKPTREIAYQYNQDYLIDLKPNINNYFIREPQNGGDEIWWQTNADGFRGEKLKSSILRVMVYGDSNIHGVFSSLRNTYCEQLEKYLKKNLKMEVEVINAGVTGFGPDQPLLKMLAQKEQYLPDLIVFNLFADNDYGDIIRNRLFDFDDQGELVLTNFVRPEDLLFQEARNPRPQPLIFSSRLFSIIRQLSGVEILRKRIVDFFVKKEVLINDMSVNCAREFEVYMEKKPLEYSNFHDHYDFDVGTNPQSESAVVKIKLMQAVLKKAKQEADKAGIPFLVVIQPSDLDLTNNYFVGSNDLVQFVDYRNDNLTRSMAEACLENKIDYVNLFQAFSDNHPEDLYFKGDDNHWNDKGQELAAKLVAESITSSYTLWTKK